METNFPPKMRRP